MAIKTNTAISLLPAESDQLSVMSICDNPENESLIWVALEKNKIMCHVVLSDIIPDTETEKDLFREMQQLKKYRSIIKDVNGFINKIVFELSVLRI